MSTFKKINAKICPNKECNKVIPEMMTSAYNDEWCPYCGEGMSDEKLAEIHARNSDSRKQPIWFSELPETEQARAISAIENKLLREGLSIDERMTALNDAKNSKIADLTDSLPENWTWNFGA